VRLKSFEHKGHLNVFGLLIKLTELVGIAFSGFWQEYPGGFFVIEFFPFGKNVDQVVEFGFTDKSFQLVNVFGQLGLNLMFGFEIFVKLFFLGLVSWVNVRKSFALYFLVKWRYERS
jgi:hypothetical protein